MKKNLNIIRESNIELLRIFSMLLIVSYHVIFHLNIDTLSINLIQNKVLVNFLMFNGKLGVNLFMIISGYFLIKSNFKLKNAIKLFINTTICSTSILIVLAFLSHTIGLIDCIKSFFPIFFNVYWYITGYFVVYLFLNYINVFLINLSKKNHLFLLISIGIILSLLPSLFHINMVSENNFLWLVFLYFIGAYIRLHLTINTKTIKFFLLGILFYLIAVFSSFAFQNLGNINYIFVEEQFYFSKQYSIFLLLASIFLFLGFKSITLKQNLLVNSIASCMIGVYLIHDNYLLRKFLYFDLLQNNLYINTNQFILRILLTIIIIFIISVIITFFYKNTVGRYVDKFSAFMEKKINNSKLKRKIYSIINKVFLLEGVK